MLIDQRFPDKAFTVKKSSAAGLRNSPLYEFTYHPDADCAKVSVVGVGMHGIPGVWAACQVAV